MSCRAGSGSGCGSTWDRTRRPRRRLRSPSARRPSARRTRSGCGRAWRDRRCRSGSSRSGWSGGTGPGRSAAAADSSRSARRSPPAAAAGRAARRAARRARRGAAAVHPPGIGRGPRRGCTPPPLTCAPALAFRAGLPFRRSSVQAAGRGSGNGDHAERQRPPRQGPADYFTGSVRQDPGDDAPEPARVRAVLVTFEPGARTAWHTHPLGQTLYVLPGRACPGLGRAAPGATARRHRLDSARREALARRAPTVAMTHLAIHEALDGAPWTGSSRFRTRSTTTREAALRGRSSKWT